jgi:hypothetical protein
MPAQALAWENDHASTSVTTAAVGIIAPRQRSELLVPSLAPVARFRHVAPFSSCSVVAAVYVPEGGGGAGMVATLVWQVWKRMDPPGAQQQLLPRPTPIPMTPPALLLPARRRWRQRTGEQQPHLDCERRRGTRSDTDFLLAQLLGSRRGTPRRSTHADADTVFAAGIHAGTTGELPSGAVQKGCQWGCSESAGRSHLWPTLDSVIISPCVRCVRFCVAAPALQRLAAISSQDACIHVYSARRYALCGILCKETFCEDARPSTLARTTAALLTCVPLTPQPMPAS